MQVVAFNGSPRKDGNTTRLINCVLEELESEGIGTELGLTPGAVQFDHGQIDLPLIQDAPP